MIVWDAVSIAGVAIAVVGGVATLGAKLVEKYKTPHERRRDAHTEYRDTVESSLKVLREMAEARDHHAKLQDAQILRHQEDLAALHREQSRIRVKLSKLYSAIDESQVEFPETREFWQQRLTQMGD